MKADRAVFQDGGLGQGPGRVRQSLGEQAQAQPDTETASRRNVKRPSQDHESSRLTPQLSLDIQIEGAHHVQMGRGALFLIRGRYLARVGSYLKATYLEHLKKFNLLLP